MAGRIAEELLLGKDEVTTGAHDDLKKATNLAYCFVRQVAFGDSQNFISGTDGSQQSDRYNYQIDMEV